MPDKRQNRRPKNQNSDKKPPTTANKKVFCTDSIQLWIIFVCTAIEVLTVCECGVFLTFQDQTGAPKNDSSTDSTATPAADSPEVVYRLSLREGGMQWETTFR